MQGIHETLEAIAGGTWYGRRREQILSNAVSPGPVSVTGDLGKLIDERQGKMRLAAAGIQVPEGRVVDACGAPDAAAEIGFPVAVKMLGECLSHKTDAGAIALGLTSRAAVETAVAQIREDVRRYNPAAVSDRFLIEEMIGPPLAELLVDVRADSQFGFAMTLASGGVFTELVSDAVTILLPAGESDVRDALGRLKVSRLLGGFRGRPRADPAVLVSALTHLADHVHGYSDRIVEVEINPLFVLRDRVCAVDVLMRVAR